MSRLHNSGFAAIALAAAGLMACAPDSDARNFHGGFSGGAVHSGSSVHGGGVPANGGVHGGGVPAREFHGGAFHGHGGFRDHGRFHGSLGIIVGAPLFWYPGYYGYYPPDYYSYPPAALPSGYFYYCANPPGYYPQVQYCPSGWQAVAPPPPPDDY